MIRGMASSPGQSSFVVQVRDAAGDEATATFEMTVCGPPLDLELGEVHFTTGIAPGGCGFSVRAVSAGSYYRMTLVGQSASWQPLGSVEVRVRGHMPVNAVAVRNAVAETSTWPDPRSRLVAARREAEEDGHLRLRREEALLLAHLTREGRLRALPDRPAPRTPFYTNIATLPIAEYEAAPLQGLSVRPARQAGCDAVEQEGRRFQIKGRCSRAGSKRGQRLGRIDVSGAFDAVLMVLLDESFEAISIHEAEREDALAELEAPGLKARNERGMLSVSKFTAIGCVAWERDGGSTRPTAGLRETYNLLYVSRPQGCRGRRPAIPPPEAGKGATASTVAEVKFDTGRELERKRDSRLRAARIRGLLGPV